MLSLHCHTDTQITEEVNAAVTLHSDAWLGKICRVRSCLSNSRMFWTFEVLFSLRECLRLRDARLLPNITYNSLRVPQFIGLLYNQYNCNNVVKCLTINQTLHSGHIPLFSSLSALQQTCHPCTVRPHTNDVKRGSDHDALRRVQLYICRRRGKLSCYISCILSVLWNVYLIITVVFKPRIIFWQLLCYIYQYSFSAENLYFRTAARIPCLVLLYGAFFSVHCFSLDN